MSILFSALFVNNIVLLNFFGLENIITNTQKSSASFGIICSVIILMFFSSIANYFVYEHFIKPFGLEVLIVMVFAVNIALVSILTSWLLNKFIPFIYNEIKDFIFVAGASSLLLGTSIMNLDKAIDLQSYNYMSLCNALGFCLIILLLTTIKGRFLVNKFPKSIVGAPILLITLGLISMAFMGFTGMDSYL